MTESHQAQGNGTLLERLRYAAANSVQTANGSTIFQEALDEIERLQTHQNRRRDTLSWDLESALHDWKDAGAPTERVVNAIYAMVQGGIDFVIAEFGDEEKT